MFEDRFDAGKQLAEKVLLERDAIVIALPRGGVGVGFPIAQSLRTALEVIIVRKLGSPRNPELGIGAIAEDGVTFLDTDLLDTLQISNTILQPIQEKEAREVERRKQLYRDGKSLPLLTNKTIILVDDGLATGVTAYAALLALKKHHPKKIIFVVPVCSERTAQVIKPYVDRIICLEPYEQLVAVGMYYRNFEQMTDKEVLMLLGEIRQQYPFSNSRENNFTQHIVW